MTLTRFGGIKRNIKLCNNDKAKSRYQEVYHPAYKFDLPYNALIENTNAISEKSYENQVIDESSWPHCEYGEAGSRISGKLSQNKKFAKDGQTVLCMDSGRFIICAYMHRHNICNHNKQGWSAAGPYTHSTYFSVIFWKWSVEVYPEIGSCFMRSQQLRYTITLLRTIFLIGLVMRVLGSLVKMQVIVSQRISNHSTFKRKRLMQL